jgi:hypothetical protein
LQRGRTGQLVQSGTVLVPPLLYFPAGQTSQVDAPVATASYPPLQTAQVLALPPLYWPAGQLRQKAAALPLYWPAGHKLHTVEPAELYWPPGHSQKARLAPTW